MAGGYPSDPLARLEDEGVVIPSLHRTELGFLSFGHCQGWVRPTVSASGPQFDDTV